jgi:hypothetical protein
VHDWLVAKVREFSHDSSATWSREEPAGEASQPGAFARPMLYYFAPRDENASVAKWTAQLEHFACEAGHPDCRPPVLLAARTLEAALQDLATVLAERFIRVSPKERSAVFRAFAQDHRVALPVWQVKDI